MSPRTPKVLIEIAYESYAQEYLRSLPLEHFMEATAQAFQRAITLACLALVAARRADFHLFNELLVQYPRPGERRPGQVVPDNMVVLGKRKPLATTCFNTPLEPAGPFWVLEYVSKSNKRKDYDDNFDKYEKELKVPYFLLFYPETQDLSLYRHNGKKYVSVKANKRGRHAIPELDLEVALLDGWVRYWYEGELLPLPAEMDRQLGAEKRRADEEKRRADEETRRADAAEEEVKRLRALLRQQGQTGERRGNGK